MVLKLLKPLFNVCYYSSGGHSGRQYLQKAFGNYVDIRFTPFRLRGWQLRENFSKAQLDIVQYLSDENGIREPFTVTKEEFLSDRVKTHAVLFSSIFYKGFEALSKSLNGQTDLSDVDLAVNAFVTGFLNDKDYHEECLRGVLDNDQENEVSAVLANHLFSRLTAGRGVTYFVTTDTKDKWQECPCDRRCGEKIMYDNAGFGSELLWYGRPDIMVFPIDGSSCSIFVPKSSDNGENYPQETEIVFNICKDKQMIEENERTPSLREEDNVKQITAAAITFSLYQKMYQMKSTTCTSSNVSLIPLIATNGEHFDIYMYDSKHDILLRNTDNPIPLWVENVRDPSSPQLNMSSVVQLWMLVNHISIQPALCNDDVDVLNETCEFISKLPNELRNKIEATLKLKKSFRRIKEEEFNFEMLKLPQSKVEIF